MLNALFPSPFTQAKSLQFWTPSEFYGCLGQSLFWLIKGFGLTWFVSTKVKKGPWVVSVLYCTPTMCSQWAF